MSTGTEVVASELAASTQQVETFESVVRALAKLSREEQIRCLVAATILLGVPRDVLSRLEDGP